MTSASTHRVAAVLLSLFIASEQQAQAYTDPGTGALIWQVLVAGLMGAMFYFRRLKTFFSRLGKKQDENR